MCLCAPPPFWHLPTPLLIYHWRRKRGGGGGGRARGLVPPTFFIGGQWYAFAPPHTHF